MSASVEVMRNNQAICNTSTVKTVNSLLNSAKTRIEGLKLLKSYLPVCSDEDFRECCTSWMQSCCKIEGGGKNSNLAVNVLNDLFKMSSNYQELNKSVSFFISTRFFDYFFKYFLESESGWSCVETCFVYYRGSCGPSMETVEKKLKAHVEKNMKIPMAISRCFALLPCLGGGGNEGTAYRLNWKNQFIRIINLCHSILNDLFAPVDELQEYDTDGHVYNSTEKENSVEYLTIQLHNYCSILYFMLLNKYPVPKCIPSDLIFQLICRGLAVNSSTLGKNNQTTDIIALEKELPEVHVALHSLLNALIVACRSQLMPYSQLICKLIKQTLDWTNIDSFHGMEKPFGDVRISAYETLSNWLVAARSGSQVETISKDVVLNAVRDIHSRRETVLLKESKQKGQQTKDREKISRIEPSANGCLCYSALKALQYLLKFSGISLNQNEHKFLQETVIKLLVDIQNSSSSDVPVPFSLSACRRELFSLLLELIYQPCPSRPPPTHFAFRIFRKGVDDICPKVSEFCSTSLNLITNIIHPQYSNAEYLTPPEAVSNRNREQITYRQQEMEVDDRDEAIIEKEPEASTKPFLETVETDESRIDADKSHTDSSEKISELSEESCISVQENVNKKAVDIGESPKKVLVMSEEGEKAEGEKERFDEPVTKKSKVDETSSTLIVSEVKTPSPSKEKEEKSEKMTHKVTTPKSGKSETDEPKSGKVAVEDSNSARSVSPEPPNEEEGIKDKRKTYFLRSKTPKGSGSSEETEDIPKRTSSTESLRSTPLKGLLRKTSEAVSSKKRPRTRASSKLESEAENESVSGKKDEDEDEDIIETFDDSFID